MSFRPPLILLSLNRNLSGRKSKASFTQRWTGLSTLWTLGEPGGRLVWTPASTPSSPAKLFPDMFTLQTFMCPQNPARITGSVQGWWKHIPIQEKHRVISWGSWKQLQGHFWRKPCLSAASSLDPYKSPPLGFLSTLYLLFIYFYHGKLQTYPKVEPPGTLYPLLTIINI